ncbi:hypothetical protein EHF_0317 [Ehrlichia japonica]|uniref:Uncharacterized protein n=1 Tax=Ehrlichia japonica TaxID=391036 RepID=X5GB71_9RICK|nr:hypothetical protein EHF_0317 [Ehrlichia japonica]
MSIENTQLKIILFFNDIYLPTYKLIKTITTDYLFHSNELKNRNALQFYNIM